MPTMSTVTVVMVGLISVLPFAAEAQQAGKVAKIGILSPAAGRNPIDDEFERSLQGLGWLKDQNIRIEIRYSGGRPEAFTSLAAELIQLGPDVLVAWSTAAALAAKRATNQLPVVFLAVGDPVAFGLVSNIARPGGNLTGLSFDAALETYPKGLQLLKEAVPAPHPCHLVGCFRSAHDSW